MDEDDYQFFRRVALDTLERAYKRLLSSGYHLHKDVRKRMLRFYANRLEHLREIDREATLAERAANGIARIRSRFRAASPSS